MNCSRITRRLSIALLMVVPLSATAAHGATSVIVDPAGGGDYLTIQSALDWAPSGSDILIVDGVYAENLLHASGRHYTLKRRSLTDVVTLVGVSGGSSAILQIEGASSLDVHYITFDGATNSKGIGMYCGSGMLHTLGCTLSGLLDVGIEATGLTYSLQLRHTVFTDNARGLQFGELGFPLTVSIGGCEFIDNVASWSWGGGIRHTGGSNYAPSLSITDTIFEGNTAAIGGAIYSIRLNSLEISGCTFVGNRSSSSDKSDSGGGCIYYSGQIDDLATISDCVFVGNTADQGNQGGALHFKLEHGYSGLVITNCVFADNTATSGGGGAVSFSSGSTVPPIRFSGCQFFNNTAGAGGGGILNASENTVYVGETLFCGNTPDPYSGPINDEGGNTIVDTCNAGACCIQRVCAEVTADVCEATGGIWFGVATHCAAIDCDDPVSGACCLARYCMTMGYGMCDELGGVFYEFVTCDAVVCTTPPLTCPGDFDYDGQVNVQDLLKLIENWGSCP
jgi:hypothetical protein